MLPNTLEETLLALETIYRNAPPLTGGYIPINPSALQRFQESAYTIPDLPSFIKTLKTCYRIQCENISLHYYTPNDATALSRFEICKLRRCAKRAYALTHAHAVRTMEFRFYIVPHESLRRMPADGDIVRPEHINGGFTWVTHTHTSHMPVEIYIYRKEEFPKVMLHEITHHLPYHTHPSKWSAPVLSEFYRVFDINQAGCPHQCTVQLEPNEAIVEFWATLFQLMFVAIDTHSVSTSNFDKLLQCEQRWSQKQSDKLVQFQKAKGKPWTEETHAFAYIVLKNLLLQNTDLFIASHTPPYDPVRILQFLKTAAASAPSGPSGSASAISPSMRMTTFGDL